MEKDFIQVKSCKKVDTLDITKTKVNGWLLEIAGDKDGFTENLNGQIYITTIAPGTKKGFHIHALATYHIVCIKGNIKSVFYKDRFTKETVRYGEEDFKIIKSAPGVAHLMENVGDVQAYVLVYRFPSWSPDLKEQLDISPLEIETEEAWQKINNFINKFKQFNL